MKKDSDQDFVPFGDSGLSNEEAEAILEKLGVESDADLRELEEVVMLLRIAKRPPELLN